MFGKAFQKLCSPSGCCIERLQPLHLFWHAAIKRGFRSACHCVMNAAFRCTSHVLSCNAMTRTQETPMSGKAPLLTVCARAVMGHHPGFGGSHSYFGDDTTGLLASTAWATVCIFQFLQTLPAPWNAQVRECYKMCHLSFPWHLSKRFRSCSMGCLVPVCPHIRCSSMKGF